MDQVGFSGPVFWPFWLQLDPDWLVPDIQLLLPSPRPWDFPPSIDGDISRADDPMELDDPE
jgi:hypothetical protein